MKTLRSSLRAGTLVLFLASALVAACGWDPSKPFERDAPPVKEALALLDGGDAQVASGLLADYLTTGPCAEGNIGLPARLHERPNATFDLGLALFQIAEAFGHRFGEEETAEAKPTQGIPGVQPGGASAGFVECAMRVARAVAEDPTQPVDLRARAFYLTGNLQFLDGKYKEAVVAYDKAIELAPGMTDIGPFGVKEAGAWTPDPVGKDAAWNRAIALRREEDKKDAGQPDAGDQGDSGKNDQGDSGKNDESPDSGKDDGKDGGSGDAGKDDDTKPDGGAEPPPPAPVDAGPPPPSRMSQDERMLDQLEGAPTVQQELAKKQQRGRVPRGGDK